MKIPALIIPIYGLNLSASTATTPTQSPSTVPGDNSFDLSNFLLGLLTGGAIATIAAAIIAAVAAARRDKRQRQDTLQDQERADRQAAILDVQAKIIELRAAAIALSERFLLTWTASDDPKGASELKVMTTAGTSLASWEALRDSANHAGQLLGPDTNQRVSSLLKEIGYATAALLKAAGVDDHDERAAGMESATRELSQGLAQLQETITKVEGSGSPK